MRQSIDDRAGVAKVKAGDGIGEVDRLLAKEGSHDGEDAPLSTGEHSDVVIAKFGRVDVVPAGFAARDPWPAFPGESAAEGAEQQLSGGFGRVDAGVPTRAGRAATDRSLLASAMRLPSKIRSSGRGVIGRSRCRSGTGFRLAVQRRG